MEKRDATINRSMPATLSGALNATRTASSRPNNANAATTDNNVSRVRVFLRMSPAQTRCKYFTQQFQVELIL